METTNTTQLAKKLLIKTAQCWLFINAPEGFLESFVELSIAIKIAVGADETYRGVLLFIQNRKELQEALSEIAPVLKPETICWMAYPKKSSVLISDLEMTGNWGELEQYQLRIVSAVSIDKTWTALRVRPIELVKKSTISNAAIENNELNEFIDTKNRIVHLPNDVKEALERQPAAFEKYQKLAYSHQKEYLVWILTAKQTKTRTGRLQKMLEKLLD